MSLLTDTSPAVAQEQSNPYLFEIQILTSVVIFLVLYAIPTFIAFYRKHPNRWLIFVINMVFGGTGIGWLGSLLWAFSAAHLSPTGSNGGESGLNLFVNDPKAIVLTNEASTKNINVIEHLDKLQTLRTAGAIDEEEFQQLKSKLL